MVKVDERPDELDCFPDHAVKSGAAEFGMGAGFFDGDHREHAVRRRAGIYHQGIGERAGAVRFVDVARQAEQRLRPGDEIRERAAPHVCTAAEKIRH